MLTQISEEDNDDACGDGEGRKSPSLPETVPSVEKMLENTGEKCGQRSEDPLGFREGRLKSALCIAQG